MGRWDSFKRVAARQARHAGLALAVYAGTQLPFRIADAVRNSQQTPQRVALESALDVKIKGFIPDTASVEYKYLSAELPKKINRLHSIGLLDLSAIYLSNSRSWLTADPLEQFQRIFGKNGFYNHATKTVSLYSNKAFELSLLHEISHASSFTKILKSQTLRDSLHAIARDSAGRPLYSRGLLRQLVAYVHHDSRIAKGASDTTFDAKLAHANSLGLPSVYAEVNSFELVAEAIRDYLSRDIEQLAWVRNTKDEQGLRLLQVLANEGLIDRNAPQALALLTQKNSIDGSSRRVYADARGFVKAADKFLAEDSRSSLALRVSTERDYQLAVLARPRTSLRRLDAQRSYLAFMAPFYQAQGRSFGQPLAQQFNPGRIFNGMR